MVFYLIHLLCHFGLNLISVRSINSLMVCLFGKLLTRMFVLSLCVILPLYIILWFVCSYEVVLCVCCLMFFSWVFSMVCLGCCGIIRLAWLMNVYSYVCCLVILIVNLV